MPDPANPGLFFTDADGNRHYVDQDQAAEAQRSGLTLVPGQTATYADPEGRVSTVKAEDFLEVVSPFQEQDARLLGGATERAITDQAAIEEEFSGIGGGIKAGAAGLARGATAGLSDLALTATGIADAETLADARAARPGLSTATELVGAIAPAVASGGTGLLAGAAKKTVAGQLAKQGTRLSGRLGGGIKGMAAGEALEGAVYGAGQGVSNLVLKDEPLTAEAALAEVGMGAVIGGVAGGGLGAAAGTLGKAAKKVKDFAGKKAVLDPLSEEGAEFARKVSLATDDIDDASKAIFADLENAASPRATEVFDSAVARNYDVAMTRHFDEVEKHIQNIESGVYSKFDDVAEAPSKSAGTAVLTKPKGKAADVGSSTVAGGGGKRVAVDVGPSGSTMKKARELLDGARKTREELVEFAASKGAVSEAGNIKWDDLRGLSGGDLNKAKKLFGKYQDDVRKMADEAGVNLADEDKLGNAIAGDRGLFDLLADVSVVKKTPAGAVDGAADALAAAKKSQGDFRAAMGAKEGAPVDLSKISELSPDEAMEAITAFDNYSKGLRSAAEMVEGGAAGSVARLKGAEKQISELIQETIGKDGKLPELAEIAIIFGVEEATLPDMGPASDLLKLYAAYKVTKIMHGGKSSLFGGSAKNVIKGVARRVAGRAAGATPGAVGAVKSGLAYEGAGRAVDFIMGGTTKLAQSADNAVNRMQAGMAKSLTKASKAARRGTPVTTAVLNGVAFSGEPGPKVSKQEAFKARSAELSAQMANLPGLQQRVHDSLASVRQVNLGVGDKMAGQAVRTMQFLHDKMPKDPGTLQQFGVSKWRPTEAQLDKWARYINAAQDPAGIVERFGNGHMSREDAETLRTLYPGHFEKVQEWVMENLPEMQKKMSYDRRIQISSLMGVAADPTVARVDVWQASFAQEQQQQPMKQMNNQSTQQPTAAQQMSGTREQ